MGEKQEPKMKKKARPVVLGGIKEKMDQKQQPKMKKKYNRTTGKDEGTLSKIADDRFPPWPGLVILYARLWLHRYNFLLGENLVLRRTRVLSKTFGGCVISTFNMFFEAEDPDNPHSRQTLHAAVEELKNRTLLLNCFPASGSEKDLFKESSLTFACMKHLMPELPSENPFKNTNRFYVLDESEQQARDWIQLYLDLAVATAYRTSKREAPTDLKIIQVSVEPTQAPNEDQNVFDFTFYIRYHDPSEARVGQDHDRIAIVRRILDKNSGELRLAGRNESSHSVIPELTMEILCEAPDGKDAHVTRRSLDENTHELGRDQSSPPVGKDADVTRISLDEKIVELTSLIRKIALDPS